MDSKELEQLAREIQLGSERAFDALYRGTSRGLFAFIYSLVRNRWDAEDLTQDTYIRIKTSIGQYTLGTNFRAWMFQIAKNLSLNHLKRAARIVPLEGEVAHEETPAQAVESNLFFEDLQKILTPKEYKIMVLHDVSGFRHREIAKLMELPIGTVTWQYSRAVKKVKSYLKEG